MDQTGRRAARREWVLRLAPRGEVGLDRAAGPRAVVEEAVARAGAAPVRWAIEQGDAVVRRIVDEVPALGGGPAAVEMLRRGNEATTLRALVTLLDGPAAAPPLGEATLEGIREFVHRAVPLEEVLRGVRAGHAATAEAFQRACADLVGPARAAEEVTAVSRDLFAYVDDLSDAMIRAYLAEHEAWSTSAAAARADLVRTLLADPAAVDVGAASRLLGLDLRRTQVAAVVWSDTPDGGPALQAAAVAALRARGATATLTVPVTSGTVWAWGTVAGRDGPGGTVGAGAVAQARRAQVALGTPGAGVAGFRRSHREARRAAEVERLRRAAGRDARPVTAYADIAAVALAATDLTAAGDFVRRELGGLAAPGAATEALRGTLLHYLDAERSLLVVARRLHVARGTVTYRVKRAQELLGHGLDDGRRLALHTALALAEELGDAVLLPPDSATASGPDRPASATHRPASAADEPAGLPDRP
ncbi:PucR family transcriptional regulator [Streptomyces sp. NPDC091281]|uniref:PucR family transcriptional regulator n=1 Tax=Streptomyces sp. NPDC091281 TaxID=3365985 RepID=UPI00382CF922